MTARVRDALGARGVQVDAQVVTDQLTWVPSVHDEVTVTARGMAGRYRVVGVVPGRGRMTVVAIQRRA